MAFTQLNNFGNMKKKCKFVTNYILKGGFVRLLCAGFFYACSLHIYGVTPVRCVNAPDCLSGVVQRVGNAVFCYQNEQILSVMNYTEKVCQRANNSTLPTTSAHETGYQFFTVETENLYLISIFKAMREFLLEESRGCAFTENRLNSKIEAARELFPEDREAFVNLTRKNFKK